MLTAKVKSHAMLDRSVIVGWISALGYVVVCGLIWLTQ